MLKKSSIKQLHQMMTTMTICIGTILLLALSLPTCTDCLQHHAVFRPALSSSSSSSRWIGSGSHCTNRRRRRGNYSTRLYVVTPPRRPVVERTTSQEADDGTNRDNIIIQSPPEDQEVDDVTSMALSDDDVLDSPPENQLPTKYVMLGLLWFIACLSAMDRVAMSVAILPMSMEFDFTDSIKGSISSLFSVGYGLTILPAGLLLANLSPRLVMAIGLATWSLATIATPVTVGVGIGPTMLALLTARAMVGAGESVILPTIQRLMTTWTSSKEKSTALAAVYSGFQAGTIAAYVLSPIVMDSLGGWRGLFYFYGSIGLGILLPWLILAKDRPAEVEQLQQQQQQQQHGAMAFRPSSQVPKTNVNSEESWETALDGAMTTLREAPWTGFLKSKGTWALLLAHCAKNWSLYIALAWTPTFYAEQYGLDVKDSAWLSVLPSIAGAVCGLVAGTTADSFLQNLDDVTTEMKCNVRKGFQSISFLGQSIALGSLALNIPDDPAIAQIFLMAVFVFMALNYAGFEAGIQDKAGEKWAGLMYSFTSLPAVMTGTFGVYCTGLLLDMTNQDWSVVFGLNAAINVLGAVAFLSLYDSKREFD